MASGVASIPVSGVVLEPVGRRAPGPAPMMLRSFYAGPENLLVRVAVESLLAPERPSFSPLLLLGPTGTGKTHLAQGLARRWSETGRSGEVIYLTGGEFAQELAQAIDDDTVRTLRSRFRSAGLFVLDDLTKLTKKPAALKELLFTLDALEQAGSVAVITSHTAPAEIPQLPAPLAGRLIGGLVITLAPPGSDARRAILEDLAAQSGITLSPEAAEALANQLSAPVPELLQTLLHLGSGARSIDTQQAERYLADRTAERQLSIAVIIQATAKQFSLKVAQLKGTSRNRTIAAARSVAMYLARTHTDHSLEQIGRAFGGRDHTTVLHNCRKIEKLLSSDPAIRLAVAQVQEVLAR